jgi:oxygen-independent coproporphyrinogen-3 oxidase
LIVSPPFPWPPRSAYLHIPFCHRRCYYCDFAVVPLGDRAAGEAGSPGAASIAAYLELLQREIALAPAGPPLSTVYLGGGTPSLLTPAQVAGLLQALGHRYGLALGAEVSLELDPASFDRQRLAGYLAAGVNRVSLGGQSFDDGVLADLGRRHRAADLLQATSWLAQARSGGDLRSWSLDLIQAVPGQTRSAWRQQLRQAVASGAPHLSVYDLSIEPGTVFGRRAERGQLGLPDDDLAADLMELTWAELHAAGYGHYEISNYARPGRECRHNLAYWLGSDYLGLGPSAFSTRQNERWKNVSDTSEYIRRIENGAEAADFHEALDAETRKVEQIAFALRTNRGVPTSLLPTDKAAQLVAGGLLREESGRSYLTQHGKMLADAVAENVI